MWSIVSLPPTKQPIGCKWEYKTKYHLNDVLRGVQNATSSWRCLWSSHLVALATITSMQPSQINLWVKTSLNTMELLILIGYACIRI